MYQSVYDQIFRNSLLCEELEELEGDLFGFTNLEGHQVACFDSGGEKLICIPQILEIVKYVSIQTIESTISNLKLVLIECSPLKLDILLRYGILPHGTNYCSLMSQSNAERLCKSLNSLKTPKQSSYLFNQNRKSVIPTKHQHRIRVVHDCFGQQKGILFPQFYVTIDSKCIECFDCGDILSTMDFVGHTHNSGHEEEISMCHWGFKSSNWRWYIRLADDPSRSEEEESSLKEYLEEIKGRYTQPMEDQLVISSDPDRQTPIDCESLNTSPSLPTPPSLSPPIGINRSRQQSGSIFQQCIMKIYNTPLANNEDRHQILDFLVMLKQEHLKQISSLISERQRMMKVFMKNTSSSQQNLASTETLSNNNSQEESHTQLLSSVQDKLSILKRSRCVKRKCRNPLPDSDKMKQSKESDCPLRLEQASEISPTSKDHQSLSRSEVIDCDSSASNLQITALSSKDEIQEIGSD